MTDVDAMVVTFRVDVPVCDTMGFELLYEPSLQMDLEEKSAIIEGGIAVWMFVDGTIAGECYGACPILVDDDVDECVSHGLETMYCYSTTILESYQGRGLGKILCAYWNGLVKRAGYRAIAGHATSPAMVSIRRFFGARFLGSSERWGGTERVAIYYEMLI